MPVFTIEVLGRAELNVLAMDFAAKLALADEVFQTQPNLLASVLVLQRFGSDMVEIERALNVLFVVFEAMRSTGRTWPVVTAELQGRGMARVSGRALFLDGMPPALAGEAASAHVADHPEPHLLACVWGKVREAGWLSIPDEPTKYRVMCMFNLAECLTLLLHPAC